MKNTQIINISLPKSLLKEIDKQSSKESRSRSELIREAARKYIIQSREWEEIFAYGKKIGRKMGVKSEEDVDRIVHEFRHGR